MFKKGIKVAKDDSKGLNCGDVMILLMSIVLLPVCFIYVPYYLAETFVPDSVHPEETASVIVPLIALILWVAYMCLSRYCNETASYLNNLEDFLVTLGNLNMAIKSPPRIIWRMEAYHWKTKSDSKGKTKRVKVVTNSASGNFQIQDWEDESAPISSLFYLRSMMLTRLQTNKDIDFSEESGARYMNDRQAFIDANNTDEHYDFNEDRTIPYQEEFCLVYNSDDGQLPWYTNGGLLCALDAVFLGWIPRMILT